MQKISRHATDSIVIVFLWQMQALPSVKCFVSQAFGYGPARQVAKVYRPPALASSRDRRSQLHRRVQSGLELGGDVFVWLIVSERFELTAAGSLRSTVLRDRPSLCQPLVRGDRLLTSIRRWQWVAFHRSIWLSPGVQATQRATVLSGGVGHQIPFPQLGAAAVPAYAETR